VFSLLSSKQARPRPASFCLRWRRRSISDTMVILGGLEFVAGGYLLHRYNKRQNQKKKLEEEAQNRRHNTFPGAKPQSYGYAYPPQQPIPVPQHKPYYPPPQQPTQVPQYKYAHMQAPQSPQPQQFLIPRRPLPHQQPPQIIQPLQRADSFATISRMPVANGYRPSRIEDDSAQSPRPNASQLSPVPHSSMNYPYGNTHFSVSTPALNRIPSSPINQFGRQTIDDNWETYATQPHSGRYAPSVSTALGEHDPPPPYRP